MVLVATAEFTLKSYPVRRTLEQRLIDDLKIALTRAGFEGFRIEKNAARLVVRGLRESNHAAVLCGRVFGVAYAAPALLVPASMDEVTRTIISFAERHLRVGQSFAIRSHRSEPGPLPRRDIELKGGSSVLQALKGRGVRVDLTQPDTTIYVDLVGDRAYVYCERVQGPGGLPLSSQWKMLAVLDSGPLTLLAAYAMMRRGCLVELFIPLSKTIPSFAKDYQLSLARKLREFVTRLNYKVFTFELERFIGNGLEDHSPELAVSRRVVRVVAAEFAREKKFKGVILADIAGELSSIKTGRLAEKQVPVFYPLLGLDREGLLELGSLAGIMKEELLMQTKPEPASESLAAALPPAKDLSKVPVEQVSL